MNVDLCPCGRELRLLNPASDIVKCVGCGRLPDQCTCVWETEPQVLVNVEGEA
jgi:hypothetical protein